MRRLLTENNVKEIAGVKDVENGAKVYNEGIEVETDGDVAVGKDLHVDGKVVADTLQAQDGSAQVLFYKDGSDSVVQLDADKIVDANGDPIGGGGGSVEVYLHKARLYDSTDENPPCVVWFWSTKTTGLTYSEFRDKFTGALLKGYPYNGIDINPVQIEIREFGWASPEQPPIQFDAIETASIN